MLTVTDGAAHEWADMPLDKMSIGNAMDCDFTLRSYHILKSKMKQDNLNHVYDKLLTDITPLLARVEFAGIGIDTGYLKVLEGRLSQEIERLEGGIAKISPIGDINPASPADLIKVLFTKEGFNTTPSEFTGKKKEPATTEAHLLHIEASDKTSKECRDFIRKILEYKSKCKLYKTYVTGVRGAIEYNGEDKIHSSYNFAATVTGRLSCSTYSVKSKVEGAKGRKVNKIFKKGVSFHTLPRTVDDTVNIRRLMIPDEGKAFIAADFSQAELRVLAQCSRDEGLLDAFTNGKDLHKYTASLVFGKPIDKVTKNERQIAKSVSFLIVYGGGPSKLASQIDKPIGYCKGIFQAYQDSFPKVFSWIKKVHKDVKDNEYAVSLFGRRRHLSNVKSPIRKYQFRALRQGMNFVIQSSASDIMLHALKRLDARLKASGLDAQILATVHDSVEIQCDKAQIKEVCELVREALTDTSDLATLYNLHFKVPFIVDIEAGTSFGDLTEASFNQNGTLTNYAEIEKFI
jgi:DNA polymerase-1